MGIMSVLNNAGFVLSTGEIHALNGENGAEIDVDEDFDRCLYKDVGQVIVDGQEVCYKNAREAEKAGIVFIHQELNVLFDLTVEENMFLGKEIKRSAVYVTKSNAPGSRKNLETPWSRDRSGTADGRAFRRTAADG